MARRYMHGKRRRRSPLKEIEGFNKAESKDKKTSLAALSSVGIKNEFGQKKATGFGALVLGRKVGKGEASANVSKVLEYNPKRQSNITSVGAGYKTKKGLYIGGEVSKGKFTQKVDYGTYTAKSKWKPNLKLEYKTPKTKFGLKIGKNKIMGGITYNF